MSRIGHHLPRYFDLEGAFQQAYHLEMIADHTRTEAIFEALRRSLDEEKVFCELGCGTGIFSLFAAKLAKKVFAVERDPKIAYVAKENIGRSPVRDRIRLFEADALEVELPERADVVLCEMMSIWAIEEPQITVFNSAYQRLLAPGGVFLPSRIVNQVELGTYEFGSGDIEIRVPMPLFTGIRQPAVLTERRVVQVFDFTQPVDPVVGGMVVLEALVQGRLNCALLTSTVQIGPGVVFSGTDSLMPPTVVPLEQEVLVRPGDRVAFQAQARARSPLAEAGFTAEIVA